MVWTEIWSLPVKIHVIEHSSKLKFTSYIPGNNGDIYHSKFKLIRAWLCIEITQYTSCKYVIDIFWLNFTHGP